MATPQTRHREPATVRVAMWSSRHRWPVAAAWFVGTIALFVLSGLAGGIKAEDPNGSPNQAQTESAKAYAVFNQGGTGAPSEDVSLVVTHPQLKATDPAFAAFVTKAIGTLKGLTVTDGAQAVPVFDRIADPATAPPQAGLVAPDLSAVRIVATIDGDDQTVERHLVPVRAAIASIEADGTAQGFDVHSLSSTLINEDITNLINSSLDTTFVTIGLTFIILLIAFGAVAAAVVPLVLAMTALLAAFGLLGHLQPGRRARQPVRHAAHRADRPGRGRRLLAVHDHALPDGAAAGPDTERRDRDRQRHRRPRRVLQRARRDDLRRRPVHPPRRARFHSMALGTIAVILVAVVGSLTFLPATLAILGDAHQRRARARTSAASARRRAASGAASCAASCAGRSLALAVAAFLLVLASPGRCACASGSRTSPRSPNRSTACRPSSRCDANWPQGSHADHGRHRDPRRPAGHAGGHRRLRGGGGADPGPQPARRVDPVGGRQRRPTSRSSWAARQTTRPTTRSCRRCARRRCRPPSAALPGVARLRQRRGRARPGRHARSTRTRCRWSSPSCSGSASCCCWSRSARW